jgi:hypothetical protein
MKRTPLAIALALLSLPALDGRALAQPILLQVDPSVSPPDGAASAAPDAGVAEDASSGERSISAVFGAGIGIGTYGSDMPRAVGSARVSQSAFPAFDVAFAVDGVTRDGGVTPGLRAAYASSVGYTLRYTDPAGVEIGSPARTHQLRVDAAVDVAFGDSRHDVSLPIELGYAWSNLRTDVELPYVDRHTLSGPHLGLRLRVPLAGGDVVLELGPDAWLVLQVSDRIRRAGLDAGGFAFGGEAHVLVRVAEHVALRALLRESHAGVPSAAFSRSFTEAQRFVTAGVAATY